MPGWQGDLAWRFFPWPCAPQGRWSPRQGGGPAATKGLTLCGRAEFGVIDEGRQVRGLRVVLLVSLQIHRHTRPLLVGDRQLLLIGGVDHRGDDRRFWCRRWRGVLGAKEKQSLLSHGLWSPAAPSHPGLRSLQPGQVPINVLSTSLDFAQSGPKDANSSLCEFPYSLS